MTEMRQPRQPRILTVDGHQLAALAYNEDKAGIPIIFIHGVISSIYFWESFQTPYVQDNHPWYSLSLPGHNPASLPGGFRRQALTADLLGDVMIAAIRQLVGDQRVILVGYSTGGFAVLNIAARKQSMALSVISISGFAQGVWIGWFGFYQRLARLGTVGRALFKLGFGAAQRSRQVYNFNSHAYDVPDRSNRRLPLFYQAADEAFLPYGRLNLDAMHAYFSRMPAIDILPLLPQIHAPVLALAGDQDPIVPPAQAKLIAETVPCGQFTSIAGAGHLPMIERPDDYHRLITEWITKTVPTDPVDLS